MIRSTNSDSMNMKATIVITTLLILTLVYCIIQHTCWSWWCFDPVSQNQTRAHRRNHDDNSYFQSSSTDVSSVELNDLPSTQQAV